MCLTTYVCIYVYCIGMLYFLLRLTSKQTVIFTKRRSALQLQEEVIVIESSTSSKIARTSLTSSGTAMYASHRIVSGSFPKNSGYLVSTETETAPPPAFTGNEPRNRPTSFRNSVASYGNSAAIYGNSVASYGNSAASCGNPGCSYCGGCCIK
jgi:hypothetical protein